MKLSSGTVVSVGIVLLACASTVAVFATRDALSTKDSEASAQDLLPAFHGEDVTRLELVTPQQKLAIERSGGASGSASFRLVEPVKETADPATVEKLLSALASARALRAVERGPTSSALGLDKPALRVSLQTKKRAYHVALGGPAPTPEGARYVQVSVEREPAKLMVVGKSVADDLSLELDAFRLRSLVPVSEADVTRIGITSRKLNVQFERSTGASFLLVEPNSRVLANREMLKAMFFQLSRLTASVFLATSEAEWAIGSAPAHFELQLKQAKDSLRFAVGGSCPSDPSLLVVIRQAPDVQGACAPRELEASLALSPNDFVDRRPFSLHADEVEELDITGGKSKFALVRKAAGFVLHAARETEVELEAGNQRILELLEAEGERVPTQAGKLSEFGLEPATSTVTLRSSAARESEVTEQVVRVGNRDAAGNLLVYREQDAVVLRLPRERARGFAADSTLLYARKLTEFGSSSFISAEIEQRQSKQVLRRVNDGLVLDEPKGFEPDGALSSDLVQTLGALTAERFVADRDDGSFGLQRSSLRVNFLFKSSDGQKVEHHLRFGDETALGVFATLDDDGPVFILARSVRDTCQLSLLNRSLIPASSDAWNAITLEAHGRTLHLMRKGERLTVGKAESFPEERVPELLEAISELRPEAALHVGPALPAEGFSTPFLRLLLSPKSGPSQTVSVGAGDSWRSTSVFYLRVSGVDATYVIARSKVRALSDAL